jgi:hypothetical protein
MRGVILEATIYTGQASNEESAEDILIFLELATTTLYARRNYGNHALVLELDLDDVETALAALKLEAQRERRGERPAPPPDKPH